MRIEHPRGLAATPTPTSSATPWPTPCSGAAGLGDIGEHYPDTDPKWSGLDSTRLLAEVVDLVRRAGWQAVNCDVIIHAQEPKLGPLKATIRANLARLLGLPESAVNVKAKTGEHVGHIGRGEAIACQAVVLLGRRMSRASNPDQDMNLESWRSPLQTEYDQDPCHSASTTR